MYFLQDTDKTHRPMGFFSSGKEQIMIAQRKCWWFCKGLMLRPSQRLDHVQENDEKQKSTMKYGETILRFQTYQIENYIFAMNYLLIPTFHFQMISNYFLLQIWYNIISYFRWCQIVAFPESYREYFTRPVVLSLILAIWVLRWCPFQQKILNNLAIWDLRCYCPLQQQKCAEESF